MSTIHKSHDIDADYLEIRIRHFATAMEPFRIGRHRFSITSINDTLQHWASFAADECQIWCNMHPHKRRSVLAAYNRLLQLRDEEMTAEFGEVVESVRPALQALRFADAKLRADKSEPKWPAPVNEDDIVAEFL